MKLAIDLLWVRPKQVGGIESYIRNLLDGLLLLPNQEIEYWLIVSTDNEKTFLKYEKKDRCNIHVCKIKSKNVFKRIIWQNMYLGREIKKLGINICFEPYYCKPFLGTKNIKFITTIHDLQALHYPEYFSKFKVEWMKMSWRNALKTSKKIITISKYVKKDIEENFPKYGNKVEVIYNPILVDKDEIYDFEIIGKKYGIKKGEFYFTVSSLLPHKNVKTIIEVIDKIKAKNISLPRKLVISGVGGKSKSELENLIERLNLQDDIILTPFISNSERNALYKYSKAFLFPSLFEGFGMPPVEAMVLGTTVITTMSTSLKEVTFGKANYVKNPLDINEWIECMLHAKKMKYEFREFDKEIIAKKYYDTFKSVERM